MHHSVKRDVHDWSSGEIRVVTDADRGERPGPLAHAHMHATFGLSRRERTGIPSHPGLLFFNCTSLQSRCCLAHYHMREPGDPRFPRTSRGPNRLLKNCKLIAAHGDTSTSRIILMLVRQVHSPSSLGAQEGLIHPAPAGEPARLVASGPTCQYKTIALNRRRGDSISEKEPQSNRFPTASMRLLHQNRNAHNQGLQGSCGFSSHRQQASSLAARLLHRVVRRPVKPGFPLPSASPPTRC